jgi:protein with PEP-CTERM/exosortase system signal
MNKIKYIIALVLAAAVWVALPIRANADATLTFGDTYDLGHFTPGAPFGDPDKPGYVDHLTGMAINTSNSALGQTFFRSSSTFGSPYPAAVFALDGTGTSVDLLGIGYQYLIAKYDAGHAGVEVWDINGLTGTLTIPAFGLAANPKYGLSGWALFNPGPTHVPDGGTTAMLLGAGLSGLGLVRRLVKR